MVDPLEKERKYEEPKEELTATDPCWLLNAAMKAEPSSSPN